MIRYTLLLVLTSYSGSTSAQYIQVSTNLFGLAVAVPNVQIETPIFDRFALEAGFGVALPASRPTWPQGSLRGHNARMLLKYYLRRNTSVFNGANLGIFVQRSDLRSSQAAVDDLTQYDYELKRSVVGLSGGYTVAYRNGFYISGSVGAGYELQYDEKVNRSPVTEFSIFGPNGHLFPVGGYAQASVGWRFGYGKSRAEELALEVERLATLVEREAALKLIIDNSSSRSSNLQQFRAKYFAKQANQSRRRITRSERRIAERRARRLSREASAVQRAESRGSKAVTAAGAAREAKASRREQRKAARAQRKVARARRRAARAERKEAYAREHGGVFWF